ncbi:related to mitochondrial outer membrane protein (Sam35) [Phialocephala subalpina]|uniref:Related to mitochondrial outer membrane protein (Sam35) n=1 Tax=Phialocephala subalpina TaxID=576137 RepID=A0A1L7WKF9_9HELO|nr:related to mitochondrial outer membrane protein (Sam35) [Phialocephala subalpina]
MPPKVTPEKDEQEQSSFSRQTRKVADLFSIPPPIKKLFDRVPVVVYPPNQLPQRAPKSARIPSLYVFSTSHDAAAGKPSFNPSCLKWQTFLNIAGVDHRLISSNNHASPTGSLPFLLPAVHSSSSQESLLPVTSNKFVKYASDHGGRVDESPSMRYEAYQSLLDHRIRNAWLYTLYLEPLNFSAVAYPLYVFPNSSNPLVRASIAYQLRIAAEAELLKHTSIIDTDDLYSEADKAFEALSILLGDDSWFFGNDKPALFDASVFAYTQLLLDDSMGWKEKKLCRALRTRDNLVQHRERLLVRYYGG